MASRYDQSYETYLRYIREAESRGIQHAQIITRKGWQTAVKEAHTIAGPKARNVSRFLEGESRVNRVSSVRALQTALKTAQEDIRAAIQQGETITPNAKAILNQKRSIAALNQADVKSFWREIHNMYTRDQIYVILGSPKARRSK